VKPRLVLSAFYGSVALSRHRVPKLFDERDDAIISAPSLQSMIIQLGNINMRRVCA
jgi:hypothetical protein